MPTQTIHLEEEGLQDGDVIDPYLSDHFNSGNEVVIPAGEYDWNGGGLGGSYNDATLRGDASDGQIIFHRPDDPEVQLKPSTNATGGTVRFENITFKGKAGEAQSRWRVDAESGATLELINVNKPDGTTDVSDSIGFFSGPSHAGTLYFERCFVARWGNLGMYVDNAGQPGGNDGRVIIDDCDFHNNNACAIKIGSDDSEVRNCRILNDGPAPTEYTDTRNQRAIRIDEAGTSMVIEDVDIYHDGYGSLGIYLDFTGSQDEGGNDRHSGVVNNVRIYNDGNNDSVYENWDTTGYWSGHNVHLTGSNQVCQAEQFETYTGSEADTATNQLKAVWRPSDGDNGGGGGDDQPAGTTKLLITETAGDDLSYTFDTNELVEKASESEGESNDEIIENGDGTYTVSGFTGNNADDGYYLYGDVTGWSSSGEKQLTWGGTEVTVDELLTMAEGPGEGDFGDSPSEGNPGGGSCEMECEAPEIEAIREVVKDEISHKALSMNEIREIVREEIREAIQDGHLTVSLGDSGDGPPGQQ